VSGARGILRDVARYYGEKIRLHGPTARGADWNSLESQGMRFAQLLKIADRAGPFSINDYGCGYGALLDYLKENFCAVQYCGFDISNRMLAAARQLHRETEQVRFVSREEDLSPADFTLASGVFNVRLTTTVEKWEDYLCRTLDSMNALSRRGFAFNLLTTFSDPERRRPHLYYGDPSFYFELCKKRYSRFVSLLHDYPLYEFTILVRQV